MTAIWSEDAAGTWELLPPAGFPDEDTLQRLVAEAPGLLPLSGKPQVVVLGREVRLGSGRVDVLGIEPGGRPVVIEVKLRNNTESRRAVVAQVLAYAAALHGSNAEAFEHQVLATHLAGRALYDTVRDAAQAEVPDATQFHTTLEDALRDGHMRVVLVLDRAPDELIRLVGFLEAVTQGLVVDLVTVTSYELDGRRFVVPQRVEPERVAKEFAGVAATPATTAATGGELVDGVDAFRDRVASAAPEHRLVLDLFVSWAQRVAEANLASVQTWFARNGDVVLLPRLQPENVGLVSLYARPDGKPALQWWRSVFERRAPRCIAAVEAAAGVQIGRGTLSPVISSELLDALYAAYAAAQDASA